MRPVDYNYKWAIRKNDIILDLNFTAEVNIAKDITLEISTKESIFAKDSVRDRPLLIFNTKTDSVTFRPKAKIDQETVESMRSTAKTLSTVANVAAGFGLGASIMGIAFQLPIMAFFLKFILIMKILNRFKFLNIDFGPVLGTFLNGIFNLFELGDPTIEPESQIYDTKTRGKLSYYRYDVLVFYKVFEKYTLYLVRIFLTQNL
jgi:hypothetical protein